MAAADDLVRIQQAHHRRYLGVQNAAGDLMGEAWDTFANLDELAAAEFTAAAAVISEATKAQTSTLAVAYMNANDRAAGFPASGLVPTLPDIRGGVPAVEVYQRSIVQARSLVSTGTDYESAMSQGRARAVSTARTDVNLSNRAEMERGGQLRPWVVGYRRVLTGRSCAFCATASTQRYRSADLMPIHVGCDCDVAEIYGTEDPGQVINQDLLDALQEAGKEDGRGDYWNGSYIVESDGTVHYRKTQTVRDDAGEIVRTKDGKPRRESVPGDVVKVKTTPHGELGQTLERAGAPKPSPIEAPTVRRSRATSTDPDVLAEASRRNVSADRVVEMREEKAQRRYLEDRARREAAKSIDASDPDVVKVAERYGVHPDEVLSARARVADVRKVAREEAGRVQAETIRELERLDIVRMKNPPRTGARTGMGTSARRGEYDWLEQLSDREKARLSRKWYGGTEAPDQMVLNASNNLGRDLSIDEGMDLWLDLNRRHEASGALRRGKLPSSDAYSGAIDVDRLLGELADDGYEVSRLFGDDLEAAAHVAQVERELLRRDAMNFLGDAVDAVEGPSPYRMSFQSWEEEVRELESAMRAARSGQVAPPDYVLRRYAEVVPQYIDEPDLDYEDLYARIIATARQAGEEVPDVARIPW